MNITFSEIAYLLSRKYSVCEVKSAYFDAHLVSVKRYRGQVENKQLYCLPVKRVGELTRHPLDKLSKCAFVVWGNGTPEDDRTWKNVTDFKRVPIDIIYIPKVEFEEDLMEDLVDFFCMLHMWDCQLREAGNGESMDITEILNDGRRVIGLPLSVFDRNFVVMGCTEDYFKYFPDMKGRMLNGQMDQTDIKVLLKDEDYDGLDEQKGLFMYPPRPSNVNLLCYNIRFSGEFFARVLMVVPEYHFHPGIRQLYHTFVQYVEAACLNNLRNNPGENQENVLHHLFKKYLFHPKRKDYETDFHVLNMHNWFRFDEYRIIVLQMFGSKEFERGASYLCQQLERLYEYSCTCRTDREIIWIINYTRESTVRDRDNFQSSFPYLIRDFGCKAGISDYFHDFTMLSNYRRQANIALELGNRREPYSWYYSFEDYTLEYMIGQATMLYSAEQLAHKGLMKLYEYDREHDTEFVKTLEYYITYHFNASEAAQKLYIHRTTFIRRMERIESLVSLKLEDPDELLHILLSYRMLKGKDRKNE